MTAPVVFLLEPQHLSDLCVRDRRLLALQRPRDRNAGTAARQQLRRRHVRSIYIVHGVEDLETQPVREDAPLEHAREVADIAVRPPVDLPPLGRAHVRGEGLVVPVRRDDGADAHHVDVRAEPVREAAGDVLAALLGYGVGVRRARLDGLVDGKAGEVPVALGVSYAVHADGAGEYDLPDAELAGGLDDVVGAGDVGLEGLVVGDHQVAGVSGQVDDCVGARRGCGREGLAEGEVRGEGVEDLTEVGEVDFYGVACLRLPRGPGGDVQVEDGVTAIQEVGYQGAADEPGAACDNDPLAHDGSSASDDRDDLALHLKDLVVRSCETGTGLRTERAKRSGSLRGTPSAFFGSFTRQDAQLSIYPRTARSWLGWVPMTTFARSLQRFHAATPPGSGRVSTFHTSHRPGMRMRCIRLHLRRESHVPFLNASGKCINQEIVVSIHRLSQPGYKWMVALGVCSRTGSGPLVCSWHLSCLS